VVLRGDGQKGKLKQKFASLTDDDLMFAEGNKDKMLGKLQKNQGKPKINWTRFCQRNW
jgi:uncharacterized protein YjbJ (UPF0337 family)